MNTLPERMHMQQSVVQEISLDSVRIFWLNYPLIIERLIRVSERFQNYPNILEVWLFGSFAHFKAVPGSDIDLLLVIRESEKRLMDRIEEFQDLFSDIGISVDIFPYTINESDTNFVQNAKKTGVCIYNIANTKTSDAALFSLHQSAKNKRKRIV
jgi:predicted nucleotidyltransferase